MKALIFLSFAAVLVSCTTGKKSATAARAEDRQTVQQELGGEMSLQSDRSELDSLRREIPEETKRSNDELALYLQLMKQGTETPQNVRDKFQNLLRKRRASFRDKVTKLRDNYRDEEVQRREGFLGKQKTARDSFLARGKRDPKVTRDFFADQEKARQAYFGDERDRRASFESEVTAQSKDFESYMREKTNEFNEQYRLYSKKYSEKPKEKKAVTGESDSGMRLNEMPVEPMGTD